MISVSDILKILDKIPIWKELSKLPKKVEELENRVAMLEKALQNNSANVCPSCGAQTFRVIKSEPHPMVGQLGIVNRTYECSQCGFKETHTVDPSKHK